MTNNPQNLNPSFPSNSINANHSIATTKPHPPTNNHNNNNHNHHNHHHQGAVDTGGGLHNAHVHTSDSSNSVNEASQPLHTTHEHQQPSTTHVGPTSALSSGFKKANSEVRNESFSSTSGETFSSTDLSTLHYKITQDVMLFLYTMQNNSRRHGWKHYLLDLVLHAQLFWSFLFIPVLSPQNFLFGQWGSWIFTIANWSTSLSMDLLPYYGAVGITSAALVLLLIMILLYIIGRRAARETSAMVVYLRKILHTLSFIIILLSTPMAFIFSSFFDCGYGFQTRPHVFTSDVNHNSVTTQSSNHTQPSSFTDNGGMQMNLNRFPTTACFASENIIMWTIALIGMIALLVLTVLSSCIIPHMHPLSTSLFKSDSLVFRVSFLCCNIVSITIHYLIPPRFAFARSSAHIVISLAMSYLVFKTIPMMRRWENSLVFAITACRLGTSIGGLISHLTNATLSDEFGIAMAMMTIGLMTLFFIAGFIGMEIYTRIVFKMFKSMYFNPQEDNEGERELLQLFQVMDDNKHLPLLYLFLKFSMASSSHHDDLLQGISFIRGVTSLKTFNDVHSLIISSQIVAYFIPDEINSASFAHALLKKAMKQRPNIYIKFLIGQKKKEIEVFTSEVIKTDGSMELKATLLKMEKKTRELTAIHRHFFKELMQEIVSYEKLERMMIRCAILEGECDSIFKNVLKLYNNDKTVLRM